MQNYQYTSVLDLFKIGIGPSSSHTVGPMLAALEFAQTVFDKQPAKVRCEFYGSLAATGIGHGSDKAVIMGFMGKHPETVDMEQANADIDQMRQNDSIQLLGKLALSFNPKQDLVFTRNQSLPFHPNGMIFHAYDASGVELAQDIYYSIGGGFIVRNEEQKIQLTQDIPYPFRNGQDLLNQADSSGLSIAELIMANETILRPETETRQQLQLIWKAMQDCVVKGLTTDGTLPGGLKVPRRAKKVHQDILQRGESALADPLTVLDWVNLYALAVNEENAAGGKVVTAPTNGAAGIIPAVLHHATRFRNPKHPDAIERFLLTAAAIGMLYKMNASISGADVGCQGEVGVACSMAAAGLTDYLGGTAAQIENAAEIGMEHNLGLTCDPIGGLVQIPCIERNAMGSVKAINAARIALMGDGAHFVSLDKVIKTMRDTGKDMQEKYKETSRGGLAVNVVEC